MSDEARREAERRWPFWMPTGDYELDREGYDEQSATWQNAMSEENRQAFMSGVQWQAGRDAERIEALEAWLSVYRNRAEKAEAELRSTLRVDIPSLRDERDSKQAEIEALEAEVEELQARYYNATAGSRSLRPGEAEKLAKALDSRLRATASEAKLARISELAEAGVEGADPMLDASVGYADACGDVLAILTGDDDVE